MRTNLPHARDSRSRVGGVPRARRPSGCAGFDLPSGATTNCWNWDAPGDACPAVPQIKRSSSRRLTCFRACRGWTPAINANCKASGATATAVAKPAFTFAAKE